MMSRACKVVIGVKGTVSEVLFANGFTMEERGACRHQTVEGASYCQVCGRQVDIRQVWKDTNREGREGLPEDHWWKALANVGLGELAVVPILHPLTSPDPAQALVVGKMVIRTEMSGDWVDGAARFKLFTEADLDGVIQLLDTAGYRGRTRDELFIHVFLGW